MSEAIVFDSTVLLEHLRTGRHRERMARVKGLVRNSAVVLAKLGRAAGTEEERELVRTLAREFPVLTPTEEMWMESGMVLAEMRKLGMKAEELRRLHLDVLLGLTARAHGARLITSRAELGMVRAFRDFKMEMWREDAASGG